MPGTRVLWDLQCELIHQRTQEKGSELSLVGPSEVFRNGTSVRDEGILAQTHIRISGSGPPGWSKTEVGFKPSGKAIAG